MSPDRNDPQDRIPVHDPLLAWEDIAFALKAERTWVYRLLASGELATVRRGSRYVRVRESELQRWIDRQTLPPTNR